MSGKGGKILKNQTREIILAVDKYFDQERSSIPFSSRAHYRQAFDHHFEGCMDMEHAYLEDTDSLANRGCSLGGNAHDSEWVDILQTNEPEPAKSSTNISDEEEVLQLVEKEDGPEMKPLAIMFPGILEKDPQTLHGMLNKAMSTTEVTKHLVDLGQKANFTFMKKTDRLIPPDKQWLESVTENSNSISSFISGQLSIRSSNRDASDERSSFDKDKPKRKKKFLLNTSDITEAGHHDVKQSSNRKVQNQDQTHNSNAPSSTKQHKDL